jgi:hypothetical protein
MTFHNIMPPKAGKILEQNGQEQTIIPDFLREDAVASFQLITSHDYLVTH